MKFITTTLLTAAMLVSSMGITLVQAESIEASITVSADGIEYTPQEMSGAEGEYYVELLNSTRTEKPVVKVNVTDEEAAVTAKVDNAETEVIDNSFALEDYGLHDIDIKVVSGGIEEKYTIHIYPTVYMVNYAIEGSQEKYTWGGKIEMTGNSAASVANVVTKDDLVSALGLYERWHYRGMDAANFYPDLSYSGVYKVYAWETYNTGSLNVYDSAKVSVTHNSVTDTNNSVTWYETPADWSYAGSYYFNGKKDSEGISTECVSVSINDTKTTNAGGSGSDSKRVSSIKLVLVDDCKTDAEFSVTGNTLNKEYTLIEEADGANGEKNYSVELLESAGAKLDIEVINADAQLEINGEMVEAENGVYTVDLAYVYDNVKVEVKNGKESQVYNITVYPTYYMAPNYLNNGSVSGTTYTSNTGIVAAPKEFDFLGLSATNSSVRGESSYTYTPNVPAGEYTVMAWTTYANNQGKVYSTAEAEISHNGVTDANSAVTWYTNPASWQRIGDYTFNGNGSETITIKKITGATIETGVENNDTDQFRASAIKLIKKGSVDAEFSVTGNSLNKEYTLIEETDSVNGEKNYSLELLEATGAKLNITLLDAGADLKVNGKTVIAENGVYTVDLAYEYDIISIDVESGILRQTYNIAVYPTYYMAPNYLNNGSVSGSAYTSNTGIVAAPKEFDFLGLSATNSSVRGESSYTYTPNVPAGEYTVMAWTTYANNQGKVYSTAEAEIYHNGVTDTNSAVTWYTNPASWQKIGDYTFNGGGNETITIKKIIGATIETDVENDDTDQFRASAIKLVKIGKNDAGISASICKDGVAQKTLIAGDYTANVTNAGEAVVILAKYDGRGVLANVKIAYTQNGEAQTEVISVTEKEIGEGYTLELFIFDSFNNLNPLIKSVKLPNN